MRHLIDLVEDTSSAVPTSEPVLVGSLDINGLAKLLPALTDTSAFQAAIVNMQHGVPVSPPQKQQLALAFISLLDADADIRQRVVNMLRTIEVAPSPNQTPPEVSSTVGSTDQ